MECESKVRMTKVRTCLHPSRALARVIVSRAVICMYASYPFSQLLANAVGAKYMLRKEIGIYWWDGASLAVSSHVM